jgi:RNA polymerase sigma factor (sigma-70 family)
MSEEMECRDDAVVTLDELWPEALSHRERLLNLAHRRAPQVADAEDCVQEAILRCVEFENLDQRRLGQFLTSTTLRLCVDVHREMARTTRTELRLGAHPLDVPGPEDAICNRAEASWVATLVDDLPWQQRDVLIARAAGLSCQEIADRHRWTYKAVESALARARSTIRAALAERSESDLTRRRSTWSTSQA